MKESEAGKTGNEASQCANEGLRRGYGLYGGMRARKSCKLDQADSSSSLEYCYRVRCSLRHRGKGAFKGGEVVRLCLQELLPITECVLD